MYKFTDTHFNPKQKRNYKILRVMYNFAGWFALACLILPFAYDLLAMFIKDVTYTDISVDLPTFWIIVFALVLWFVLRWFAANRCINCFSTNSLEEQSEKITGNERLILIVTKQMKCKKCGFECEQITTRTGSTDGIGRMSRDINRGGKSRLKGESYTSWWRRNNEG